MIVFKIYVLIEIIKLNPLKVIIINQGMMNIKYNKQVYVITSILNYDVS